MTRLTIYRADGAAEPLDDISDRVAIADALGAIGVRYRRWNAEAPPDGADDAAILAAYAPHIERLRREGGYQTADVIRIPRGTAVPPAARDKFRAEHTHGEDEVRFFVEGSGAFYFRDGDRVLRAICVAGDLLSVPTGIPHWFDMGAEPDFTVIRLFTDPAGWVAVYTGDPIALQIPDRDG